MHNMPIKQALNARKLSFVNGNIPAYRFVRIVLAQMRPTMRFYVEVMPNKAANSGSVKPAKRRAARLNGGRICGAAYSKANAA